MFREKVKRIVISLMTNPILLIIYWIFLYELASVCRYGREKNNIFILFLATIFLFPMIIVVITMAIRNKDYKFKKLNNIKLWKYISIIIVVFITLFYGFNIYKSATNYGGKLAWVIEEFRNHKTVKFTHNNIYKDGVQGIFEDINKKFNLPKKLYMTDGFTLNFKKDGTITSFDTFIYGENDSKKEETYLISYDENKSNKINVILRGNSNGDYNDDKLIEPLIETIKAIPLQKTVQNWNSENYGLVYYGKRNWGYNTDGIVDVYKDHAERKVDEANSEIIGYTVSIFVPGKEKEITPIRYNLICDEEWSKSKTPPKDENDNTVKYSPSEDNPKPENNNEQFYASKEVGYRLDVTGAALGSRSYSLSKTTDGGKSWKLINTDPFNGMLGGAAGVTFINDKLGFVALSISAGASGDLYRTDDGGKTFKKVSYANHKVKLDNGEYISPFDLPGMPYEKDGVLNMLVGQGSDGDYNGNCKALYESKDKGKTWKYVKEVKSDEINN